MPPVPVDPLPRVPPLWIAAVVPHVAVLVVADETMGIVGTNELDPAVPTTGSTPIVGTAGAELTPELLISVDSSGIPTRATPPGVVGDVGAVDETTLPEPDPHIPDIPAVPSAPDVVDIPEGMEVPALADVPVPTAIPPPSNPVLDPVIDDGAVPRVEQIVPPLGIEMVPVTPLGAGLMPGDPISVEPSGMPVGPTVEFVAMPSGEVSPIVGVGVAIPPTCAIAAFPAAFPMKSAGTSTAINENRVSTLGLKVTPLR